EAALAGEPAVREAAVIARTDAGPPRLVGYVVPRSEESLSAERLRRRLEEKLPRYMVPASFVVLPEMPRTANGKPDLRALPAPNGTHHVATPLVGPRTGLEEFLAGLWCELLGLETVGVDEHFFEAGGSSLQAVVVTGRLRAKLRQPVHVSAVFDSPTIAGLARRLSEMCPDAVARAFGSASLPTLNGNGRHHNGKAHHTASAPGLLVPLQTTGSGSPLFLMHPPGGIVACYHALASHRARARPVSALGGRAVCGGEDPPATLEEMAAEYVAAIRTVQPAGPYLLGGWSLGGVAAFEVAQQLTAADERVDLLALLDT